MKTLHLNLKRKWFDMIRIGEKLEEYRDISDYWARRFIHSTDENGIEWQAWEEMLNDLKNPTKRHNSVDELLNYFGVSLDKFDTITFSNGYAKGREQFVVSAKNIKIATGRPDWGAEKNRYYFVFELGDIERR